MTEMWSRVKKENVIHFFHANFVCSALVWAACTVVGIVYSVAVKKMDGAIIAMTMMMNVKIVAAEDAAVVNEEEDLWFV